MNRTPQNQKPTAPAGLIVPQEAIPYILYQRTGCLWYPQSRLAGLLKWCGLSPSTNSIIKWESRLGAGRISAKYGESLADDYRTIAPYLPPQAVNVLDVGCGLAGIDVLIDRHYQGTSRPRFHLLDKSSVDSKIYYGFQHRGAFYNSLQIAGLILEKNGIERDRFVLDEVQPSHVIASPGGFDLVVSLISWGFHYPVGVYLDQVWPLMKERGVLILDVRKETDGMTALRQRFSTVPSACETPKFIRAVCVKT